MTGLRRSLGLGLALTVALSSCGLFGGDDGQGADPTTTTRATTTRPVTTTTASTTTAPTSTTTVPGSVGALRWRSCDGGFQCATLRVPLDHRNPRGPQIDLALSRRRATTEDRLGSIIMNPGGPGASAIEYIQSSPLPTELTDHFDIVGFDPRGVGASTPLRCHSHLQEMYDADPSPDTPEERAELLAVSRRFTAECARKYRRVLPFLGTAAVARDLDLVRAALGEDTINYIGLSYGTSIGQQYARLFPTRIRTMVLDGVVDQAQTGLEGAADQAKGFTRALDAFLASADSLQLFDDRPAAEVLDEVIAAAETKPIRAPSADRPAGPGVVQLAISRGLYTEELWPQLARALLQADRGNGSGLVRLADAFLGRRADGTYPNGFEAYFGVSCLDAAWPAATAPVLDAGAVVGAAYPRVGEAIVTDYVRCPLWATPPQPLTPVPSARRGLPATLVISTTNDPATPYEAGVRLAARLPGAVLVTNVGEGHTAFAKGTACVDATVTRYVVDAVAPTKPVLCR